ncbi:MAG TPA: class I SAM-dependent methyltransferase [Vicinamibacterales bacterium]|nr:class I SAM-dependent methyltransferase [Vicinamibacterales bacterium]
MAFRNVYGELRYADTYATLDWSGTYWLVRRDLPGILARHVHGCHALDFGCGTGRSTRLLTACGFAVTGVDISEPMLERARAIDPAGRYHLIADGDIDGIDGDFDLVLAAFPFDNIPNPDKPSLLRALGRRLSAEGLLVNVVSSPDIYTHEWASFSTQRYPANASARDGDVVRIVTREFDHALPAEDILRGRECYRGMYERSGFDLVATYTPLGKRDDGCHWISELDVAPWVIDVLKLA